ncbi:MAG: NAD+ synthase [Pseudomonadota bacterium]|nr:NAD+ synthase [Pseudomonadota bacterium]
MSGDFVIALAQFNPLVGDIEGNADRIVAFAAEARDRYRAGLVVFPELSLTGYPPEDLVLRPGLHRRVSAALEWLTGRMTGIDVLVGLPLESGGRIYNAAALLRDGRVAAIYHKRLLPNYRVFDEKRYFTRGDVPCVVETGGVRVGVTVCEDIWEPGPAAESARDDAELLVNLNASPYHLRKYKEREAVLAARAGETGLPVVYVNQVGGQDELVFDGESLVMGADGGIRLRAPAFEEGLWCVTWSGARHDILPVGASAAPLDELESIYRALVLGVRDYARKNGFRGAIIGLSGGIDSALTLAIAVDALGADSVHAVMMPSRYTSSMSLEDARAEAGALGVAYDEISIEPPFEAFLQSLAVPFEGLSADETEENIQARIRGILLMAYSNKFGRLVLTTGNKSEMAVGYATLYGDMAGGFAPLKDVSKTRVFALARYRNRHATVIPERVITRPPSAELAPDQKDEDSLPPYSELDPILEMFVERDWSIDRIVASGYDEDTVSRVVKMVLRNEYKRRQAPPGVRITRRAFGKDRRYPITSGFGAILDRREAGKPPQA